MNEWMCFIYMLYNSTLLAVKSQRTCSEPNHIAKFSTCLMFQVSKEKKDKLGHKAACNDIDTLCSKHESTLKQNWFAMAKVKNLA